jgi:hypothetical protein
VKGYDAYGTGPVPGPSGSCAAVPLGGNALEKPDVVPVPQEQKTQQSGSIVRINGRRGTGNAEPDER